MPIISIQKVNNICHISTIGAQVLECKIIGQQIFYKSHNHRRSGVPILFPFAGVLDNNNFEGNNFAQHGFARDLEWTITEHTSSCVVLKLEYTDLSLEMQRLYPYKFCIFAKYELKDKALVAKFRVESIDQDIKIAPGIHPYFPASKIRTRLENRLENIKAQSTIYDYKNFRLGLDHDLVLKITDSRATKVVHWSDNPEYTCWEPWTRGFDGLNQDPIIVSSGSPWKWQIRFKVANT
jgi:galactose mutarotase-like enzyme